MQKPKIKNYQSQQQGVNRVKINYLKSLFRLAQVLLLLNVFSGLSFAEQQSPDKLQSENTASTASVAKDEKLVVAPILISNPAFGDGGGVAALYFLGEVAQARRSRLIGQLLYSDADSYVAMGGAIMHLNNDNNRAKVIGVNARIRNSFDDLLGGTAEYDSEIKLVVAEYLTKVEDKFFIGPKVTYKNSEYIATNNEAVDYFDRVGISDNESIIVGAMTVYDSRDNDNFPYQGLYFNGTYSLSSENLGGDDDYQFAEISLNHYHQLANSHVIAFRHSGYFSFDAPYSGQAKLGNRNDLRGYTTGEMIAEHMLSNQIEYRWLTASNWSYVGFIGLAGLYNGNMTSLDDADWYKSIGVGVRYRLQDAQRVNFRVDFAVGDDDNDGFYVSLREAF